MGWKVYDKSVVGQKLKGDPTMPPTRWWNHFFLLLFQWKLRSVIEVTEARGSYRVGYVPFQGPARLREEPITTRQFAVLHGHEDCTFFVLAEDGRELPFVVVERTIKDFLPDVTFV